MIDIANDHQELFGKPLKNMTQLVDDCRKRGIPLRAAWEETNKVPDRRKELADAEAKRHDDAIRADERVKVTSELVSDHTANIQGRRDLPGSPLLGINKSPENKSDARRDGVAAAVTHFREAKYAAGQRKLS